MLGRGPLRNPFIFVESFLRDEEISPFTTQDYWEVIWAYFQLLTDSANRDRTILLQLRKVIIWWAGGFPKASSFREKLFQCHKIKEVLKQTQDYFMELFISGHKIKKTDFERHFYDGGTWIKFLF